MDQKKHQLLERFEGITLKSIDYREFDKILYIFTQSEGVKHLIVKGAKRPKSRAKAALSPLVHAEFLCEKKMGQSELTVCREISTMNLNLFLRENIDMLESACAMARAIQKTQLPNCPTPLLFELFKAYIEKIKNCSSLPNLVASFHLKLLRHDGILALPPRCNQCEDLLTKAYFYDSQPYCQHHAPPKSLQFNEEELNRMATLTFSRDLREIMELQLPEQLPQKIQRTWYS
ncbi:MAG: DNA repair protein RecO [Chlamydiota bacterium]|nr:DNA repair protein RecO [Chlamydiota bacterium]